MTRLLLTLQILVSTSLGRGGHAFALLPEGPSTACWRRRTMLTRRRTTLDDLVLTTLSLSPRRTVMRPTLFNRRRRRRRRVLSSTTHFMTDDDTARRRNFKTSFYQKQNNRYGTTVTTTTLLLALWYLLSVGYNIYSKKALLLAPTLAWTTAGLQMCGGLALYVWPRRLLLLLPRIRRSKQQQQKLNDVHLTMVLARRLAPLAVLHSLVHIGGVISMGAGAVSFTYVVKASEPAISAVLAAATGLWLLPLTVYLTLIPIIMGVAMVSVSELSFAWKAFNYAMLSSVASASRAIVGKQRIIDQDMKPLHLYYLLTILSSVLLIPLALLMEGRTWSASFRGLMASGQVATWIGYNALAALFYYTYNEVAFMCLGRLSPISHSIASTLKRVVIIVSSVVVFGNRVTPRGWVGTLLAVGGVFWYSVEKTRVQKQHKT